MQEISDLLRKRNVIVREFSLRSVWRFCQDRDLYNFLVTDPNFMKFGDLL